MPRLFYDLHLHSCLSPCGDEDMTPNNIVNMAILLGYDILALTDHNSCLNTPAAVEAGKRAGLTVVPGMELCVEEEAHVVCLFPTVQDAMEFHAFVAARSVNMKNDNQIFGRQVIMDAQDCIIGEEPNLLISSAQISVNEVMSAVQRYHGTAFPAHVDKNSYSIIASLGVIPPEAGFSAAEISRNGNVQRLCKINPELNDKILLCNSDAHYLENMPEPAAWLDLPEKSPECLVAALNGEINIIWSRG